jgi:hypothetical protein
VAIAFRADGGYNSAVAATSSVSVALTVPTNVTGDLLIMWATVVDPTAVTATTPSGWASYTSFTSNLDDVSTPLKTTVSVFYRYASSEPATYTVSASGITNTSGFSGIEGNIRSYSGTAASSPFNSNAHVLTCSGSPSVNTVPALSETFVSGELYVVIAFGQDPTGSNPVLTNSSFSPATTSADFYTNGGGYFNCYNIADYAPSGPGAPGSMAITWPTTLTSVNDAFALAFTVKPLPPSSSVPFGSNVIWSG